MALKLDLENVLGEVVSYLIIGLIILFFAFSGAGFLLFLGIFFLFLVTFYQLGGTFSFFFCLFVVCMICFITLLVLILIGAFEK